MLTDDDRASIAYVDHFKRSTLRQVVGSGAFVSIYSDDGTDFDVQQATEIGALLLLDKPLVLLLAPGAARPTRLMKAADVVIEDFDVDDPAALARLHEAVRQVMGGAA